MNWTPYITLICLVSLLGLAIWGLLRWEKRTFGDAVPAGRNTPSAKGQRGSARKEGETPIWVKALVVLLVLYMMLHVAVAVGI